MCKKTPTHPIYFLIAKLNAQQENIMWWQFPSSLGRKLWVLGVKGTTQWRAAAAAPPSALRLSAFFKFHRGWQFGWKPQNLFCPSVLLFLEQLSKVAQGSSCKRTNLPLKSGPWGNSGTLLINSESPQPASLPNPLWRYETLHFQAYICLKAGMHW